MERIIKISALLLFVTVFFGSCMEDADVDVTYYSDTAITSFSVTNFNTYHKTYTSDGRDSIYMKKEDGKKYHFYIDQTRNEIYNPDSLPVGTDAKHLICAITTAKSGNLFIKSATSDSLSTILSNDSLNFTTERIVKVVSIDGKYSRDYKVKVNVHKELADKFVWNFIGENEIFANSEDMKLVTRGKDLVAFVKINGTTEVHVSSMNAPAVWTKMTESFDAEAYKNAIVSGDRFFIISNGKILSSDDASVWKEENSSGEINRLAGSDNNTIYALTSNRVKKSIDNCHTWVDEMLGDNSSLLPAQEISFMTSPLKTNEGIARLTIVGNRDDVTDKYASVWSRLVEYTSTTENHAWNYIEQTSKLRYRLPRLIGLKVVAYADGLYALGGDAASADKLVFNQIYFSKDGGITWLKDERFIFPFRFMCDKSFALTTDGEHNIWLLCGETGQIWRGRLNGLAWENKN